MKEQDELSEEGGVGLASENNSKTPYKVKYFFPHKRGIYLRLN